MELKVPSGRILWHFYIYLCSAWVVMLVVILWDWTEMKRVLSQIAYNIGLCSVESPVSFSPFSYNMTHCTFFSYCCWIHSAFYLRLLKKNIKCSQIQSNSTFKSNTASTYSCIAEMLSRRFFKIYTKGANITSLKPYISTDLNLFLLLISDSSARGKRESCSRIHNVVYVSITILFKHWFSVCDILDCTCCQLLGEWRKRNMSE